MEQTKRHQQTSMVKLTTSNKS